MNRIDLEQLTPLQRAVFALKETRDAFEKYKRARNEPIAIVGMACRFPGGADDPEGYWRNLHDGVDTVTEIPPSRWDMETFYDPDPEVPSKSYVREAAFLSQDIAKFDSDFFRISPREVVSLEPQQRLLLEVAWEALEHAAVPPDKLVGSRAGVFMGMMNNDYVQYFDDLSLIDPYCGSGNEHSFLAGRLSYVLGLQGPSMVVATACSSSLVSVHLAAQSLRLKECDLALAGGANLMATPRGFIVLSKMRAVAPDGRCKTFDAAADGYGRGEGCGVLVLKRLSDAVAGGDNILALVRGSAINQDGPSGGLTVPNGPSQEALLKQTLADSGVDPRQVGYVEAHGTGTSLGDPIEMRALGAVLAADRSPDEPLLVGSVKTNIGHLESAAGIAGLIKVMLAMEHEQIPPHLHFHEPSPHIPWDDLAVAIPTQPMPWPRGEVPRIAAVNAFALSGTNAHVLVEEAPPQEAAENEVDRPLHVLALSAKVPKALRDLARRYESRLAQPVADRTADVCFTAGTGRAHFNHRLALIGESHQALREQLSAFLEGGRQAPRYSGVTDTGTTPRVAFLFTGQGSQYAGMGRQLYDTQPTFRRSLESCSEILEPYLERPLLEVLYPRSSEPSPLDETAYTQPALFAMQYALTQLWQSWGVEPTWALGHSVGEYTAACVAGIFSLEDGLRLIAERGRLMQSLPPKGEMAAVAAPAEQVEEAIADHRREVSIAAFNGPADVVISGRREAVEAALERLRAMGVKTQTLRVSHAFHSPLMEPILEPFESVAAQVAYSPPRLGLISNLTGAMVADEACAASYWRRHVRQPVRFADGMEALRAQGCELLLEVGPQPTLLAMGRRCWPSDTGVFLPSLRRDRDDWPQMLRSMAELYVRGVDVDWAGFDRDYARRKVVLPTYPFQRQRSYWIRSGAPPSPTELHQGAAHPLLGRRIASPFIDGTLYESRLSTSSFVLLEDHRIFERVVAPAALHLSMVLLAARESLGERPYTLTGTVFPQALILPEDGVRALQLLLPSELEGESSFELFSRAQEAGTGDGSWTPHASGKLTAGQSTADAGDSLEEIRDRCPESPFTAEQIYQRAWDAGLELGPSFRWMGDIRRRDGEALGRMRRPEAVADQGSYPLHPGLIDSCFQLVGAAFATADVESTDSVYVPLGFESLRFHRPSDGETWCHVRLRSGSTEGADSAQSFMADLRLLDETGQLLMAIDGLELRQARTETLLRADPNEILYELRWQQRAHQPPVSTPAEEAAVWLVLADAGGVGEKLAKLLDERGETCVLARAGDAFAREADDRWQLAPERPEDFSRLLGEAVADRPCRGVVHLWSLNAAATEEATAEALEADQIRGCASTLHLVQAMLGAGCAARLWLVTRGCQAVTDDDIAVGQAPLWGLGRVVAREHPENWGALVDLGRDDPEQEASDLLEEIWAPEGEDHLAFRGGERYAARLLRRQAQPTPSTETPLVRADGTYLITGGLGGLGLVVARWLVAQGARYLVLMGRRGASGTGADAVAELEAAGAQVVVARADVSRKDDVFRVVTEIGESMPPLMGVVHSAGVLDDGMLLKLDWSRFWSVMAPKVAGAWNLHTATASAQLDFFVLFSSMAAQLPPPGQGNYAAANAFLDALAHYRRRRGMPCISLGWGPWEDSGMAAEVSVQARQQWEESGIGLIAVDTGLEILERLLKQRAVQVGVFPVNWPKLARHFGAGPLLGALVRERRGPRKRIEKRVELLQALEQAPSDDERYALLEAYVREEVTEVLILDASSPLEAERDLFELGMDSMMAVELRTRIKGGLEVELPMVKFLEKPSVSQFATELLEKLTVKALLDSVFVPTEEAAAGEEEWEVTQI